MTEQLDTHQKALALNLDRSTYGTIAEIGAGQEVARWFYRVGGAAGTVAKSISAYDMAVSDAVYGRTGRYVSRERLLAMLDHELALLRERLEAPRGAETKFFAFADTVAARNYAGTNECHGWLGIRFQTGPLAEPSQILLHVNLRDPANALQQEALGILGVNLIHGAFHERDSPERLLAALGAGLSLERIELDALELSGPAFPDPDPRRVSLQLVRNGHANAIVLPIEGRIVPPTEALRKRPVLLERGHMRPAGPVRTAMLDAARARWRAEFPTAQRGLLPLFELSLEPATDDEVPGDGEILRRADDLLALGVPVLLTRFAETYRLTGFLRRYTQEALRFVVDLPAVLELLETRLADEAAGGALEALGRLFNEQVKVYVFPVPATELAARIRRSRLDPALVRHPGEGLVTAGRVQVAPPLGHLYAYLLAAGWFVPLESDAAGTASLPSSRPPTA